MYIDYKREFDANNYYVSNRVLGRRGALRRYIDTGNHGDRFFRRRSVNNSANNSNRVKDMLTGAGIVSALLLIVALFKKKNSKGLLASLKEKVLGHVRKGGSSGSDVAESAKTGIFKRIKNIFTKLCSRKGGES